MCPFLFAENYIMRSIYLSLNVSIQNRNERTIKDMYREVDEYNENVQLKIGQRIQEKRIGKGSVGVDMEAYLDITANSYSRLNVVKLNVIYLNCLLSASFWMLVQIIYCLAE